MRLRSSQGHPEPSGLQSIASTERARRRGKGVRSENPPPVPPPAAGPIPQNPAEQEINRDVLEQHAAAYVEAIRLRMIAQGIPFEAAGIQDDVRPSIRAPVFDRLGPPHPVRQADLRPRLVKSAIEVPPRKVQSPPRPRTKERDSRPDSEESAKSRRISKERHQRVKRKEVVIDSESSDDEVSVARSGTKKSQRLEDQMTRMAKELEQLKKGKHQGIQKNPLGEMNTPFSKRVREAGLPPKFRMLRKSTLEQKTPSATWKASYTRWRFRVQPG